MTRVAALIAPLLVLALTLFGCAKTSGDAGNRPEQVGQSAQALQSSVFELTFNTAATINVKTGDVIRLKNFPSWWTYSSVEVNFDAATTVPMSLTVGEGNSDYTLTGWNKKIVFPFRHTLTQDLVVKSGSGSLRVTYWVSDTAASPPDPQQTQPLPTEGPAPRDLGGMNAFTSVSAAGGLFTIKGLPSGGYNVVSLVLEARDGKALSGVLKVGGEQLSLSGASQKIMFKEHGRLPVAFELSFPERRSVALKWYTEDRVPASKVVARATSGSGSSVTATYAFSEDHAVQNDVSLTFNPGDFSDGQLPVVTRLEHNPQGVRAPERPDDLNGATYDVKASLKPGKVVQIALPVPEIFLLRGIDEKAASVMHYDQATKLWTEIAPDRVSDGYVYFSTSTFSPFFVRALKTAIKVVVVASLPGVVTAIPALAPAAVAVVTTTLLTDLLVDATKVAYNEFVKGACAGMGFDLYKMVFADKPWSAPKPDLSELRNLYDFSAVTLERYPNTDAEFTKLKSLMLLADAGPLVAEATPATAAHYEAGKWVVAAENAKLLLGDVLAHEEGHRRFKLSGKGGSAKIVDNLDPANPVTYSVTDVFMFTSRLFAAVPHALRLVKTCDAAFGLADEFDQTVQHATGIIRAVKRKQVSNACREALLLPGEIFDWSDLDAPECGAEATSFQAYFTNNDLALYIGNRDDQINYAGEFLNVMSAAAWIDPDLRDVLGLGLAELRDEVHAYVGLTHDAYGNNNIPIKAMAGVALWDMLTRGDKTAYISMRGWLEAKIGDQGGYAEGTGYLQYINDDVPYLVSAMVRGGLLARSELPQRYLKTADWLLNQSRFLGGGDTRHRFWPVEVDDGKPKDIDFMMYSYLTGSDKYRNFAKTDPGFENVPVPLGYLALPCGDVIPGATPCKPLEAGGHPTVDTLPDVYFADGVGVVRARTPAGMATLSVIAEKGLMREGGRAHDQQDNGSVTLGHSDHWAIIEDAGYNGFADRGSRARFDNHNVVMTTEAQDYHGERGNPPITYQDIRDEFVKLPEVKNLDWAPNLAAFDAIGVPLLSLVSGVPLPPGTTFTALRAGWESIKNTPIPNTEKDAGGADADLLGPLVNDLALHTSHGLEVKHTSTAGVTNRRFLLSFAGNVWVIDRPENKRALRSQMQFVSWNDDKAFQYPTSGLITNVLPPLPQHDDDHTVLYLTQHLVENGSTARPPVFVTALRSAFDAKPDIREFACPGGVCLMNIGPQGQFDEVMIPYWGEQFLDDGNMQNRVRTGQIVLAHRDPHAWVFRLVGDESPALRATSLGARTNFAPDVVYRLDDDGHFTANFRNGTVQTL